MIRERDRQELHDALVIMANVLYLPHLKHPPPIQKYIKQLNRLPAVFNKALVPYLDEHPVLSCDDPTVLEHLIHKGLDMHTRMKRGSSLWGRFLTSHMYMAETSIAQPLFEVLAKYGPYDLDEIDPTEYGSPKLITRITSQRVYDLFYAPQLESWDPERRMAYLNQVDAAKSNMLHHCVINLPDNIRNYQRMLIGLRRTLMAEEKEKHTSNEMRELVPYYIKHFTDLSKESLLNPSYIQFLCEQGVNVNQQDSHGNTTLHFAISIVSGPEGERSNHGIEYSYYLPMIPLVDNIVHILLANGADPSIKSERGASVYDYLMEEIEYHTQHRAVNEASKKSEYQRTALDFFERWRVEFLKQIPHCTVCDSTDKSKLKLCGRCRSVYYCSREHQTSNWDAHKTICRSLSKKMKNKGNAAAVNDRKNNINGSRHMRQLSMEPVDGGRRRRTSKKGGPSLLGPSPYTRRTIGRPLVDHW